MRATLATAGFLTVVIVAASPLAAAAPPPVAAAGPSPVAAVGLSPALVKTVRCSIARHEAVFHARMQRLAGAERMAMRFTLLERGGAGGFAPVKVPGLRRWHRSRPGVSAFGYRQGVRNLMENAVYRMRVDFRWFSPEGELVRSMRRRSSPCRQYGALPNLRAKVVGQTPSAAPGVVRYLFRLKNDGNAAASDEVVEVRADPDDTIAESSEEDNADAVDCDHLAVR
jgi:hypothetical protein